MLPASKSFDNACGSTPRQLIRRPTTGFATAHPVDQGPGSRKTLNLVAHSVHSSSSTSVLTPLLDPCCRLLPLQPQRGAVCVGPCWGCWLPSCCRPRAVLLTSSSTRPHSPAAASTDSTSQRDTPQYSFLLAWTWLFDYHSLIDIDNPHTHFETPQKTKEHPTKTLLSVPDRGLHIHNIPRDVDDLLSTYVFTSISLGATLRAVNHTAAALTHPPPSLLAQTNTGDATLVD